MNVRLPRFLFRRLSIAATQELLAAHVQARVWRDVEFAGSRLSVLVSRGGITIAPLTKGNGQVELARVLRPHFGDAVHMASRALDLNRPGVSGHFVLCLYPDGMRRFRAA
ncbi:hypothetical protein [Luteipulveratus halotolerans]|uniref:Uncharacterized protein n=1 Tax=Luteipulveratus halotolerans TaxID=1631356 RepID=A0A0L6CET2_9MICO|nr:hypothetical protein [Luteipulveratus halotolerans]KNX36075.1 hypothetical protein VV01_01195 [Luteipulveratus halotolerans]